MIYLTPNAKTPEEQARLKPYGAFTDGLSYPVVAMNQQPGYVTFFIASDDGSVVEVNLKELQKQKLFRVDLRVPGQQAIKTLPPKGPVATPEVIIDDPNITASPVSEPNITGTPPQSHGAPGQSTEATATGLHDDLATEPA